MKVTLVATGFNGSSIKSEGNQPLSSLFMPPASTGPATQVKEVKNEVMNEEEKKSKSDSIKTASDIWDIPTFLRKKKK